MLTSLQPHGLQHARLLCPSLSPWVCSKSWSLSWCCHPTISSYVTPFLLPSIFLSMCLFQWVDFSHLMAKVLELHLPISTSNEYSGLISFRIDWLDLAVPRALKSLLQHHNSKALILLCLAFFMIQLSHP